MKKLLYLCMSICMLGMLLQSCDNEETYADQKKTERQAIENFLRRDVKIQLADGETICDVGYINVISEEQFYAQDSITNLEKNEYVLFNSNGVYMQILRKGVGNKLEHGDNKNLYCRFLEYNIMGDSVQLYSNDDRWVMYPDVMSVSNSYGTFSGSLVAGNSGYAGAMLNYYGSGATTMAVPTGWLIPLGFIHIGRQLAENQEISKVRLIIPHSQGHGAASTEVRPYFYEITFQESR